MAQGEYCQANAAYVNITDLTRTVAGCNRQFTSDGLHYSGSQMQQWALVRCPWRRRY